MLAVLPVRHQLNMAAFEKYMPGIHAFFKEYQPSRPFRFFCNENGIPNILWLDDKVSLYGDDPFAEAQAQIAEVIEQSVLQCIDFVPQWYLEGQIHIAYNNAISELKENASLEGLPLRKALDADIPLSFMYGIGLGYQLGYLYEKCRVRNLFAFEPDLDMFYASLYCFDWHQLLEYMEQESLSLHLFIGVDEQLLVADMMEALHRKGAFWSASYFSFCHYHSPKLHDLIDKAEGELYLLKTGWGFFDDNIYALAHSHTHLQDGTPFLKRERDTSLAEQVPVFVSVTDRRWIKTSTLSGSIRDKPSSSPVVPPSVLCTRRASSLTYTWRWSEPRARQISCAFSVRMIFSRMQYSSASM